MANAAPQYLPVKDLSLDLRNYRTVPQSTEEDALHALVSIDTGRFWGLAKSLISDGYEPTDNIIVIRTSGTTVVKEGNRRVGAMKLILGLLELRDAEIPTDISKAISMITPEWKVANASLPCLVFDDKERNAVDRLIGRIHGKAEDSQRLDWPAVAKARHNRAENGASEPSLDLLEKFLENGRTVSDDLAEVWSGDYPLTVLEDFIKTNASRFGAKSARELADAYPKSVKQRSKLDEVITDIGHGVLKFRDIRVPAADLTAKLGLPPMPQPVSAPSGTGKSTGAPGGGSFSGTPTIPPATSVTAPRATGMGLRKTAAVATTDPKSIRKVIRQFKPRGSNREKLVDLLTEARTLKLETHPLAFCFVLRSILEISATLYCEDRKGQPNVPSILKPNGESRSLDDLIASVHTHLTNNGRDKGVTKRLHSAMSTLRSPTNFLSVTSLNHLIHGTRFTVDHLSICTQFHNIFPLIQAMNE